MRFVLAALVAALAGIAALAGPSLAQGPPPGSAEPLSDVLRDADGDRVPDRLGQPVAVEGWALMDQGALGPRQVALYLGDATGGVGVRGVPLDGAAVQAGDPIAVEGTLEFRSGIAFIEATSVRRRTGPRRDPSPVPYASADAEALEGQLVEIEGAVAGLSHLGVGRALMISLDDLSLVAVLAFDNQPESIPFDVEPGDRVRVVGLAGQFDRVAPYSESYQIYPRGPDDVHTAGVSASTYRYVALGASLLLVLAAGFVIALRIQVGRRVEDLKDAENWYRTLVDRASDAVLVYNLDGSNLEINQAARSLIGVPEGAPTPPMLQVISEEDHPVAAEHLERLREHGYARSDFRAVHADGSERLLEVESKVIDVGDEPRVLSLGRDVSARRAYEQGLVEAREAAEATARARSAFLANMSHEIRTPLTAVIGFADMLRYEVPDDAHDLVEAIESGGRRLLDTLNAVLDLARLDAEGEQLHPAPLDVVEHARRAVGRFAPTAQEDGLWIDLAAPDNPLPATLDACALDRVLDHLVGNAVKFTERGGVTVSVDADDRDVVLSVSDTGIGIDEDFLANLFEAFQQQSQGDSRSHEGSGLGLAITDRLVNLMGGAVHVESVPGAGTTFTVTLPRNASPAPPARPASADAAGGAKRGDQMAATASPMASGMAVS